MPAIPTSGSSAPPRGLRARVEGSPYNTGLLFLVLGLVLTGIGVVLAEVEHLYATQGRTTDAVVLRTWGTGAKAQADFRFTLPDGREMKGTQGHYRPTSDRIRIEYVTTHPRLSRVAGQEHRGWLTLIGLGVVGLTLGLVFLAQARRGQRLGLPAAPEAP